VAKRFGGPWRVAIQVPVGRPALVSRIVAIAHDTLTRSRTSPYELVLVPVAESATVRSLPVINRPTRRLQAA
jgi:hypothetical protein